MVNMSVFLIILKIVRWLYFMVLGMAYQNKAGDWFFVLQLMDIPQQLSTGTVTAFHRHL